MTRPNFPLDGVLITHELDRRVSGTRDLSLERAAYIELARMLATTPEQVLRRLVELAIELCHAGTAGVSLLEPGRQEEGGILHWIALAGVYAMKLGGTVPECFSPCGDCLRRGTLQLYARPSRVFPELAGLTPPIVECLIVPLGSNTGVRGTLWIMTHSDQCRGFTRVDADIMTGLADVTAAALALHEDRAAADAALRATRERVGTVTHDLLAALTPTLGWTSMLLSGRATAASITKALAGIHASVHRQAQIVERLVEPEPSTRP